MPELKDVVKIKCAESAELREAIALLSAHDTPETEWLAAFETLEENGIEIVAVPECHGTESGDSSDTRPKENATEEPCKAAGTVTAKSDTEEPNLQEDNSTSNEQTDASASSAKVRHVPTWLVIMVGFLSLMIFHQITLRLGEVAHHTQHYRTATLLYSASIFSNPFAADAYAANANLCVDRMDPDRAISMANQALRLDPNNAAAYLARGRAGVPFFDERSLRFIMPLEDINKAITLSIPTAEMFVAQGDAEMQEGDWSGAIASAQTALNRGYRTADVFRQLAQACDISGDTQHLSRYLSAAIALEPTKETLLQRARMRLTAGSYQGAIDDARQAIDLVNQKSSSKMNPLDVEDRDYDLADAYETIARASHELCQPDNVIAAATEALKYRSDAPQIYDLRSEAEKEKGMYSAALQDLNQTVHLQNGYLDEDTLYRRALLKACLHDVQGMDRDMGLARAMSGTNADREKEVRRAFAQAP